MKLYILYTGGTIGCVGSPLSPMQGQVFVETFRQLLEPAIADRFGPLEIQYDCFGTTLDSTNMQPSDWVLIARKILDNFQHYDAFLVLHGTDTMAWTTSALAFLLPDCDKPVTVTGSQLPLFDDSCKTENSGISIRKNTDAVDNILGAVSLFRHRMVEIGLFFADRLYRGCRAVKSDADHMSAFSSPMYPELGRAKAGSTKIRGQAGRVEHNQALSTNLDAAGQYLEQAEVNIDHVPVVLFRLFPACYDRENSFLVSILDNLCRVKPAPRGIVFEAYGQGNIPDYPAMREQLKKMHDEAGMILVDCTQVYRGTVDFTRYATGNWLKDAGVLSGGDMTSEAAQAKLIVLLARSTEAEQHKIENLMLENLAGERSDDPLQSGGPHESQSSMFTR